MIFSPFRVCMLILGFFFATAPLAAQNYDKSIGVRVGLHNGVTYKQSLDGISAIEGILSLRSNEYSLTGLYESHLYVFGDDNFYMILGVGAHIAFANTGGVIGGDGLIGIEYAMDDLPLAFTADVKPAVDLIGRTRLRLGWFGLSFRYTF